MICRRNYKTDKGYSVLWFSSTGVDELGHAKFYGVDSNLRYINIINKQDYATRPAIGKYDVGYVDGNNIYIWCTLLGELNYHNINDVQANLIENGYTVTIVEKNENLPKYITESKNYVGEQQGVVDSLIQRLSVIKGELWYNPTYGLPLVDKIRSKGLMDAAVADIIYNQPDVELINSFTSDIGKSYIYSFDFSVITIYTPDSVRARLEVGS